MLHFSILSAIILVTQTSALFTIDYPPPACNGTDTQSHNGAPCGDFTFDFSTINKTTFQVQTDTIALTTSNNTTATWKFRITRDQPELGRWIDMLPAVTQNGQGAYCVRDITVPLYWHAHGAVIKVVQSVAGEMAYKVSLSLFSSRVDRGKDLMMNGWG